MIGAESTRRVCRPPTAAHDIYDAWTVVAPGEPTRKGAFPTWRCRCLCGREKTVRQANLRSRSSKSCGCQRLPRRLATVARANAGRPAMVRAFQQFATAELAAVWPGLVAAVAVPDRAGLSERVPRVAHHFASNYLGWDGQAADAP